jgi:hypothetical protein
MRDNIHSKIKIDLICVKKNFIKNQFRSSSKIKTFTSENLQEAEGRKIEQPNLSYRKRKLEITQSKNQKSPFFYLKFKLCVLNIWGVSLGCIILPRWHLLIYGLLCSSCKNLHVSCICTYQKSQTYQKKKPYKNKNIISRLVITVMQWCISTTLLFQFCYLGP